MNSRFLQIGILAAIVVVAAAAIFASSEALSFSAPEDSKFAAERAPADQAQPQDYVDNQFFYFGPDFMCLLYVDAGTVECFGSDTNGVVSSAPTDEGFTHIDGGDTYACAFNFRNYFTYCWGSITLEPSTTLPTATPEVTATPEPTATAIPPGVTPEPTATSEPTVTPADPCYIALPENFSLPVTITGAWVEECVYPLELEDVANGDRYYQWTGLYVISASVPWTATLTSDEDTYMVLWEFDDINEPWTRVDENDDISRDNKNSRITWTPTAGKRYILDLTTYTAETLGEFTLTITSGNANMQNSADQQSGHSGLPNTTPLERRQ